MRWRQSLCSQVGEGVLSAIQAVATHTSPSFSGGEGGWITVGRTAGYGEEGNADVFRLLLKDGEVVREVNLTKSAIWDSAPVWGSHQPIG
jgi:hypothetical protein